jgi:hypothetical protein
MPKLVRMQSHALLLKHYLTRDNANLLIAQ